MVQIDPNVRKQLAAAQAKLALYTKIVNGYKAQIRDALGDETEALIGTEVIATYEWVEQYREVEFEKKHPELYAAFAYTKTVQEVNWELLKKAKPDLVREFQTRKLLFK